MNTRTNLAYDHTNAAVSYPIERPHTSPNVRIKVSKKKEQTKAKRANATGLVKLALVVACAFVILLRGVMITDKCCSVEKKQAELNALVASNEKLQVDIDRSLDLDKVETIARDELGMRRAEKHQTIYLDMSQSDYVEKVAKNEFSPLLRVGEFFSGLMSYFA